MSFTFLRWIRFGVAAALNDTAITAGTGPRARVTVGVDIAGTGLANTYVQTKTEHIRTRRCQRHRRTPGSTHIPISGSVDFESTYFAHMKPRTPLVCKIPLSEMLLRTPFIKGNVRQ